MSGHSSIRIRNSYPNIALRTSLWHKNNLEVAPCVYREGKGQHDTSNRMDEDMALEKSSAGRMFAHKNGKVIQGRAWGPILSRTSSYTWKAVILVANCIPDIAIASEAATVHLVPGLAKRQILHSLTTFLYNLYGRLSNMYDMTTPWNSC
jgi:hypothetical protein